jgi:hypothetical protein
VATPIITLTADRQSYSPGDPITVTVSVVDPDNSTERLVLVGQDSQGNSVSATLDINRSDLFTITSAQWERTGVSLSIDQANMRIAGVVPSV